MPAWTADSGLVSNHAGLLDVRWACCNMCVSRDIADHAVPLYLHDMPRTYDPEPKAEVGMQCACTCRTIPKDLLAQQTKF